MESQAIEQNQPQKTELNEFQLAALKEAEKQLENLKKENSAKKYLVDLKKQDIELLSKFICNDAPWKFTESLGIKEVNKELQEAIKSGKMFSTAVAIEATYYYLSKVEGKGTSTNTTAFAHIEDYLRIIKSITNALERTKVDTEKVRQAEFVVAARREGIDTDDTILQSEPESEK